MEKTIKRILFLVLAKFFLVSGLYADGLYYVNKSYVLTARENLKDDITVAPVYVGDQVKLIYVAEDMMNPEKDEVAKVKLTSGEEGYMPWAYLQKKRPPESKIRKRTIIMLEPTKMYVDVGTLMVRNGPGVNYDAITSLGQGTPVLVKNLSDNTDTIQGKTGQWALVDFGGMEGWTFQPMLTFSSGSSGEREEPWEHIKSGGSKVVRPPFLRVRDEPGKMGAIVGSLRQGESVQILERLDWEETYNGLRSIWVKVRSSNVEGYVFGGFLASRSGLNLASDDIDKPFMYPMDPNRGKLTSRFGMRTHGGVTRPHNGIDVGAPVGVPIYAARDGQVVTIRNTTCRPPNNPPRQRCWKGGYGNVIILKHDNGFATYYAHLSKFMVKNGDRVNAGDTIGLCGNTGNSSGPHLHFETRLGVGGKPVDPAEYMVMP